jgi:hypothetical protein
MVVGKAALIGGISGCLVLSAVVTGQSMASGKPAMAVPTISSSSTDLAKTVAKRRDLRKWWPSTRTVQAPIAGIGVNHIASQGICWVQDPKTGAATNLSIKIGKRQAWSDYRIGPADTAGVISIITEYKRPKKARKNFKLIKGYLRDCTGSYVDRQGNTVTTNNKKLKRKYGTGLGVFTTFANANQADWYTYTVIARKGKAISFNRYSEETQFQPSAPVWASGKPLVAMNKEREVVMKRYTGFALN